MAALKLELDEYLARNNDTKPLLKNAIPVSVPLPKVSKWFKRVEGADDQDNWFSRAEKDCCPTMTKLQRISGFCFCVVMGIICFSLSSLFIPMLILKARKFAILYTLGSIFLICR
uniref:Vesicle transport protein n=1 Tax=Clastoptera arizonana TaxID=38151 RepID=A0A1B6CCX2_9HEMI